MVIGGGPGRPNFLFGLVSSERRFCSEDPNGFGRLPDQTLPRPPASHLAPPVHPFSISRYHHSKAMPVRDVAGACRYLDCGNLPFTKEMFEFHREKANERKRREGIDKDYILLLKDYLVFEGPLDEGDLYQEGRLG